MTQGRKETGSRRLVRLLSSFYALVAGLRARSAGLPDLRFEFEGRVVLVKDVGSTPEGARNVIVTFRITRAISGPLPKYLIIETRIPPAPELEPGMACIVSATTHYGEAAEGLAPAIVCGVREAVIQVAAVPNGEAAA